MGMLDIHINVRVGIIESIIWRRKRWHKMWGNGTWIAKVRWNRTWIMKVRWNGTCIMKVRRNRTWIAKVRMNWTWIVKGRMSWTWIAKGRRSGTWIVKVRRNRIKCMGFESIGRVLCLYVSGASAFSFEVSGTVMVRTFKSWRRTWTKSIDKILIWHHCKSTNEGEGHARRARDLGEWQRTVKQRLSLKSSKTVQVM